MGIISSNAYLTVEQMTGNAQYILDYLCARGWSKNGVCGMLGNMQAESTINPGIWQSLQEGRYDLGFGLVQWTPATNYTNWAAAHGYAIGDINGQLQKILEELENGTQYYPTKNYPETFREFSVSQKSVEYLAEAFLFNYERPGDPNPGPRRINARYWFDHLTVGEDATSQMIDKVIEWMIAIANDNSHGYDQANRWGPDYDCSSFIIKGWQQAGVPIFDNQHIGYTGSMRAEFLKRGFNDVTSQVNCSTGDGLLRGDICLTVSGGHVVTYIGNSQIVHASINEFGGITGGQTGDQTGKEICVRSYYNGPWEYVLRYQGGYNPQPEPQRVSLVRWIPA